MEERNPVKGVAYILIAWLFFTVMMIFTRSAAKTASLPTILFFQNFIGVMSVVPWTIRHGIGYVLTLRKNREPEGERGKEKSKLCVPNDEAHSRRRYG